MSETVISIKDLSKSFGDHEVLRKIDIDVHSGEVICIVGSSGSGKSTLLRCINKLEKQTSGKILYHDKEVRNVQRDINDYRSKVGMVFQSFNLVTRTTVIKNVLSACVPDMPFWRVLLGAFRKEDKLKALESLDKVGILDKAYMRADQLSGGQQQRVALARILCSEPEAILLDEPFSALDSYLKWNLEIELADLLATFNGPILWVSHDRDECYRNCRSVCVMEDGRTGEVTPMDEMIRHPGSVSAARLAGCKNFFAAEARDGKVYLPEWNVALPLAGMENTFTTIGIPDNAVTMSENGAMSCTVCRMILGVEENILLLRPEGSAEGAPMLRITVGHESDLQAGVAVRVALDYSKLLLL